MNTTYFHAIDRRDAINRLVDRSLAEMSLSWATAPTDLLMRVQAPLSWATNTVLQREYFLFFGESVIVEGDRWDD